MTLGFILDPMYFLFIAPAFLLAMIAQLWIKSAYSKASEEPARVSGAAAARDILDRAGLHDVGIEEVPGHLSDHYDPSHRVLRLSREVYHGRSAAAVGIAAHEAGHALQHAANYAPLVVRNLAVPAANFGSGLGIWMVILGAIAQLPGLVTFGIIAFSAVVAFQVINLPVEFDASSRARRLVQEYGIVSAQEMGPIRNVLNAAALTYVAATLQAVLTLLYLVMRFGGSRS